MFDFCDDENTYTENPFVQIPEDPPILPFQDEDLYRPYHWETGDDWIWNENDS